MSYAGTLPCRGFLKDTKDITHIWLELANSSFTHCASKRHTGLKKLLEAYKDQEIISAGAEDGQVSNRIILKIAEKSESVWATFQGLSKLNFKKCVYHIL